MPSPAHMILSPILENSASSGRMSTHGQTSAYPDMTSTSSYIRSHLGPGRVPRSPDPESQGLKNRSPRTPSTAQMEPTLAVPDYQSYPSAYTRPAKRSFHDISPSRAQKNGGPSTPKNVPSQPLPRTRAQIPKSVVRLVVSLVALAILAVVLTRAPTKQILDLAERGSAAYAREELNSGHAKDGYEPPQIRSANMAGRANAPRSTRISVIPHPIPSSHELLALQSYLLQSSHNALPAHVDTSQPLDGNVILAISPTKFGRPGSKIEAAWLKELEREREEEIVIWVPSGTGIEVEDMSILLGKYHAAGMSPAYIHMEGRSDEVALGKILDRLGIHLEGKPMMLLGNTPLFGGRTELTEMAENGSLEEELLRIGWLDEEKVKQMKEAVKKEKKDANRKGKPAPVGVAPRIMNAAFKH